LRYNLLTSANGLSSTGGLHLGNAVSHCRIQNWNNCEH